MSESKTISLRIPENILTEIDRIAQEKYKSHKGTPNRSLVILDALEAYINTSSCDAIKKEFTSHDDVLTERIQDLEKTVSQILEDFKQFKELSIAVNGTANKVSNLPDPISIIEPNILPPQSDLFAVSGDANNTIKSTDEGLTAAQLADRLGKKQGDVTTKKFQTKDNPNKFVEWVKKLDPDGWEWEFREEKGKRGKYHSIKPLA